MHELHTRENSMINNSLSLSLHFNGHFFPGEPGLAGFNVAKGDGGGGGNWSYKMYKAPVKPTNH